MTALTGLIAAAFVAAAVTQGLAQEQTQTRDQKTQIAQAFEHYDAVRTALSADTLDGVAGHARQLAPLAAHLGDSAAKASADALAAATNLDEAREAFGDLSATLVPTFMASAIPGATGFMCEMKKRPWMQKGDATQNPYYGKSMSTCGTRLPAAKKNS